MINFRYIQLDIECYVQRIGRTARGGKKGNSYSYFTQNDKRLADALIKILEETKQKADSELRMYQGYGGGGNRYGWRYQMTYFSNSRPLYSNDSFGGDMRIHHDALKVPWICVQNSKFSGWQNNLKTWINLEFDNLGKNNLEFEQFWKKFGIMYKNQGKTWTVFNVEHFNNFDTINKTN